MRDVEVGAGRRIWRSVGSYPPPPPVLQKLGGARLKAVWMPRAESMGGWGAVIVSNQRSLIKDGMYEAEKELTYLRDFNSGGGRIVLFMHSSSLASVRRRAWVTFLRS